MSNKALIKKTPKLINSKIGSRRNNNNLRRKNLTIIGMTKKIVMGEDTKILRLLILAIVIRKVRINISNKNHQKNKRFK
jgi:hypothetical protein